MSDYAAYMAAIERARHVRNEIARLESFLKMYAEIKQQLAAEQQPLGHLPTSSRRTTGGTAPGAETHLPTNWTGDRTHPALMRWHP